MQGWRDGFALAGRFGTLGLALVSLVAASASASGGGGYPIDPGMEARGTTLQLAASATMLPRNSSVTLTATVKPGIAGVISLAANGVKLGTVNVEAANSPAVCPPSGPDGASATQAGAVAAQSEQQAALAAGSTASATGCETDSSTSASLTVPANTLPAGANLIEASFVSDDPIYKRSVASLNLTVTDASTLQVSFVAMPRGGGYDVNWTTFVPVLAAGVNAVRYEWDFNGDGVVDLVDTTGTAQVWRYPQPGSYTAKLVVRDSEGAIFTASQEVKVPYPPPVFSDLTPLNTNLPVGARPTINAAYSDPLGVDLQSVRIELDGVNVTALASVSAAGVSYTPAAALAAGIHTAVVTVANPTGSVGQASWTFSVAEVRTYKVSFISPGAGATVINPQLAVTVDAGTNEGSVSGVTLNGQPLNPTGLLVDGVQKYEGLVMLADGQNTLSAVASFDDGQTRSTTVTVEYDAPPRVTVISPADKAVFGRAVDSSPGNLTGNVDRPITVTGRVERPVQSVTINQQQALLDSAGLSFSFPNFFLHEGANLLNVVATDARGHTGSATLSLSVDQTAPILNVESPRSGALTRAGWVDVRGMVNDAVEAGFGSVEPQVFVSVNGQPEQAAVVADRYFKLMRLPLSHGLNRLTVRAVDSLGNERSQTLDVHKMDTGLAGLVPVDGQDQTGAGRTELPKPLVVLALDANGEPVANQMVDFIVERGTGSLSPTQGQSASGNPAYTARAISVATDSQGRASAWFTTGKQSGPGANLVRAASPALGGEPVLFIASTLRSDPARITADLGINQIGETDAQVMEILSAVIRDAGDNYLPGVRVQFRVEDGKAAFLDTPGATVAPDGQSIIVTTDKNGVAAARPRLGSQPGVVRISAQAAKTAAADFSDPNAVLAGASYVIRAKQASDGPTSFSGFIYSDKGQPLQGVRVSIGRTALLATSDDKGYFEIANVPPGRIDLFVDGRAVNPGNDPTQPQWPSLHFEAYVVRGQKNELPHAIYLPALLTSEAKVVGGNNDVVLTIPGLEGFSMTVKANSVTFPDGSRTGTLIVSPVTADKLPMAPPAGGAQFGVPAWTIQPAGTRFDPPIQVRMPNSTNEQPGDNLPVVQWDHDLGQYVPMGRATVSTDGAWLVTDPGSGVTKAGWGGICRYDPPKCAVSAVPELTSAKILVQGWQDSDVVVERVKKNVTFKADVKYKNCAPTYEWDFDGVKKYGESVTHIFMNPRRVDVKLKMSCRSLCKAASDPPPIETQRETYAARVTFSAAWSDQFPGSTANGWNSSLPFQGNATGPANKPYALMAVRNDDAGYVRVIYKVEPQSEKVVPLIKFAMVGLLPSSKSGSCPNASGAVGETEACIKVQSPSTVDVHPTWGIDKNKDGVLSEDEVETADVTQQWKFRMVSKASYNQATIDYNAGVELFGPMAQEWLNSFRDGYAPGMGQVASDTLAFDSRTSGLAHAVGGVTTASSGRVGISKSVTHLPNSSVVQAIMNAPAFSEWVFDVLTLKASEINQSVGSLGGTYSLELPQVQAGVGDVPGLTTVASGTAGVDFADLYAILGDAQVFRTRLRFNAKRNASDSRRIDISDIRLIDGEIEDVFDWDYDVTAGAWIFKMNFNWLPKLGPMAKAGAMLQAAHGTIGGVGGMAFRNRYILDSNKTFCCRQLTVP